MIDDKLLATLRERARGQGVLTTDDLRAVLPIETLSADDLAMIVLQLEDAGLSLEVTDDLLGTSRRRRPTSPQTPVFQLPGTQTPVRSASQRAPAPGVSPDAFSPQEPIGATAANASGWKFVAAAGALIGVGALMLFYFTR
ncbi:MAG: hypothetical protein Q8M31_22105 [Beijerinckiaceae bacterium]|nr:hypothetical protein [Beijerinckiaceae bacterium]